MNFRQGVQAEVLLSLALVMVTGTALLTIVLLKVNHARIEALHGMLGKGLVAEAQRPGFLIDPIEGGAWWRLDPDGRVTGVNASAVDLDDETRALGIESLERSETLVVSSAPWDPLRFAAPGPNQRYVVAGRIDAPVSSLVLGCLILVDVLIFGLFGVTLLQRRVVGPLHRLSEAVREIGEGGLPAAVPVGGAGEIESLGLAFNEMQNALASRTGALEKAVFDLRSANLNLMAARDGLDRAERLAMVGSLAAGVAHEVGNPMGALLAFLELVGRDPGLGDEGRRCLDRATQQGERVRVILRQLLDFSRPPRIDHVPIALEEVVHQVIQLISAQKEYADIEFEICVEEGVGLALGDSSIASQILLNLALNASSAMQGFETKKVRFEIASAVRRRRVGDAGEAETTSCRSDSILCRISDSGPGVQVDDPERIFDPFFTTKSPGEGTGLGLANARRLAQEMGGSVDLELSNSPLGGAVFQFLLSAVDAGAHVESKSVRARSRLSVRPDSGN